MLCDWFAPGYRAGGPITSCVNLTRLLRDHCELAVLTGSKDLGDSENYHGIGVNQWNSWEEKASVFYGTKAQHLKGILFRSVRELKPQTVYLNSMFSWKSSLLPVLFQRSLSSSRIILAPRGMLKPSALRHRPLRKRLWLKTMRQFGLDRRILFHATSIAERSEIQTIFGNDTQIIVLPNVPHTPVSVFPQVVKNANQLNLAFVGRWHPIKNLLLVLQALKSQIFNCELHIVGPQEDGEYTGKCQQAIQDLPANIQVKVHGALPTESTMQVVSQCHAMILPTEGENFGHAIFEAFGAGVPVIISDQTQWRNLSAQKAGWDLPLDQPEQFSLALQTAANLNQEEWEAYRWGAHQLATRFFEEHDFRNRYLQLFFGDQPLNT